LDTNADPDLVDYPIAGNDDATKSVRMIISYIADSVIEGRKKFLSYLSHEGVAVKDEKAAEAAAPAPTVAPGIVPEEEVKIKEIEEIIEDSTKDDSKDIKKSHAAQAGLDKAKAKRKV
jgi:small subunit ribosomal protein S2